MLSQIMLGPERLPSADVNYARFQPSALRPLRLEECSSMWGVHNATVDKKM